MKVLKTETVHENPIFRVEEREVEQDSGESKTHWVVVRKPGVQVVALNNDGRILLVKERRQPKTEFSINLPGGKAEQFNGDPEFLKQKAQEELLEEAGYEAGNIEFLRKDSRRSSWLERDFHIFAAWDLKFVGPSPEVGEEIIPFTLSVEEVEKMSVGGELPDYLIRNLKFAIAFFQERGILPE